MFHDVDLSISLGNEYEEYRVANQMDKEKGIDFDE